MIKAVLDTNVLVSAVIKPQGKPAQIVDRLAGFELLLSNEILEETHVALHYKHIQKRFHPPEEELDMFLAHLRKWATIVKVSGEQVENLIPHDPPDNWVLACAALGGADYLVSGNDHLVVLQQYRGVQIIRPAAFLEILKQV